MLNVGKLSVVIQNVIVLNVVILNVIMLNVIILNVKAQLRGCIHNNTFFSV